MIAVDWVTFAVAVYAALAGTAAAVVAMMLLRRSAPRLKVMLYPEQHLGLVRVVVRNVGRLPIQVHGVDMVGRRADRERVAMNIEESYGNPVAWPVTLYADSAHEWAASDWLPFAKRNGVVGQPEAVVHTSTGSVIS